MREALDQQALKNICNRIAERYDLQHTVLTARSDERGRRMLVDKTVRYGDMALE